MLRTISALTASTLLFTSLAMAQAPATAPAALPRTASPAGAKVYIVSPTSGATVKSPFKVVFGLSGMGIAPAGTQVENTGHHHLLIDTDLPGDLTLPLPAEVHVLRIGR